MKFIANMHGNEVLGRELLLHLADHLCESYKGTILISIILVFKGYLIKSLCINANLKIPFILFTAKDEDVRKLVDSTRIHLMPSMNPDGWKNSNDHVSQPLENVLGILCLFNKSITNYLIIIFMKMKMFRVEKISSSAGQTPTTST